MVAVILNHRKLVPLLGIFLLLVTTAFGFSVSGGDPLFVSVARGVIIGTCTFVGVTVVYGALLVGSIRQLRLFQALFFVLITIYTGAGIMNGDSVPNAVVQGFFTGSLNFIPLIMFLSLIVMIYWAGKHRQTELTI